MELFSIRIQRTFQLVSTLQEKRICKIFMKNMILIILEVQIIFDLKIGLHGIK